MLDEKLQTAWFQIRLRVVNMSSQDERRRSERLWITLPLYVEGTDPTGQPFGCAGRVVNLSRHGARIQIPQTIMQEDLVRLSSLDGNVQADFRVVGVVAPNGSTPEYGLELVDHAQDFWQIEFPPPENPESEKSKVLLECKKCNTIALLPLTLSEVQAVRSMGWVGKLCPTCTKVSLWSYAKIGINQDQQPSQSQEPEQSPSSWISTAVDATGRNHRRVYVIMPLEVLDARGNLEATRTENISKCGFCFASDKDYQLGETITVIFENAEDSVSRKTELPATIVREQAILGTHRKLYGASYC